MPRILVADDDPYLLDLCASVLEEEGFEVVLAHDGGEALLKFKNMGFDVALIDLMMPVLDGLALCMKIKNWQDFNTPIITTSASRTMLEQSTIFADAVLAKPFELDALLQAIYQFTDPDSEETTD